MAGQTSRHTDRGTCQYGAKKPGKLLRLKEARAKSRIGSQSSSPTCSQFKNSCSRLHSRKVLSQLHHRIWFVISARSKSAHSRTGAVRLQALATVGLLASSFIGSDGMSSFQ